MADHRSVTAVGSEEVKRRLNFQLLDYFQALMHERHVSRAAAAMGIGQPAMSAALARLRELFNDPLLIRTNAGMVPTQRAIEIAQHVNQIFALVDSSLSSPSAEFDLPSVQAHIHIAASEGIAFLFVPKLMERLRAQAPGIRVTVKPTDNRRLREYLEGGVCDIALSFVTSPAENLRCTKLYPQRLWCMASANHPEIAGSLSLDMFQRYPHAAWGSDPIPFPAIELMVDNALREIGMARTIGARVPNIMLLPSIVAATDMLATVPERIARSWAKTAPMQILRPPLELGAADISMFWHEKTHSDPLRMWLRGIIRKIAEELRRMDPGQPFE